MLRTAPGGTRRIAGSIKLFLAAIVAVVAAATGIVVASTQSVASSAPVLSNGYGSYDLGQETPFASTTLTAAVPTPSTATTLSFTTITATSSVSYNFSPIGSVDVTSAACGLDVFDYTAEPYTTSGTSVSGANSVTGVTQVAGNPTCSVPSGSTVSQAGAPDQFNVATLIAGGIGNVNPASLAIVSQPPTTDGFAQVTTTATTGVITMQPESTATGNFSVTYAYCDPGVTLTSDPSGLSDGNCSTGTLTYVQGGALDMGESVAESIETVQEYNPYAFAQVAPSTVADGSTIPWTFIPESGQSPVLSYSSFGNARTIYTEGNRVIMPIPTGLSYVPGSISMTGGDAVTSGDATAKYCTAATTGCDAQINTGNYKTTYPYIEEELPATPTATGGALTTMPTVTADFTATGAPGSTPGTTITEDYVYTSVDAPILGTLAVNFDAFPAACSSYAATGNYSTTNNASGCTATVAYTTPTVVPFTTITPAVSAITTGNGSSSGPLSGGSSVTVTGSGLTGATQVYFGSTPATSFTVNSNTSLTAVAPVGSADGPVDVTVVSGGQTSPTSGGDQFTYAAPAWVPDAPTSVMAAGNDGTANVSWTGAFDEGSTITGSTVTADDVSNPSSPTNGQTCTTSDEATTTCAFSGLTDGDSYTFTVTSTNTFGTSTASAASNTVDVGAPQAPTGASATTLQNTQSTVSWLPPAIQGSGPPTSYTVTAADSTTPANGGQTCTYTVTVPETDTCTVTGLTNGDTYTFTVTATNGSGTGPASAPSNAVVPATVPGAPTIGTATAGNASASVAFTAPGSNGGQPITDYTVTATDTTTPANGGETATGTASPITVPGLTNGDSYTFTVTATNAVGTSAASAASAAVTPATVPGAPTNAAAVAGNALATVTWTAPASNGGSAITSYKVTSSTGSKTCTATAPATTCNVTGLTNGTAYTFTVTATNAKGTSAASAASNSVTPATVPGAPTAVTATPGNGSASVAFTAPSSTGGSAITGYTVTATDTTTPANGGETATGTASPITVTGLTNGDNYTFTVTATNALGTGAASTASTAIAVGAPTAPTGVTALSGNASATVSWTPSTPNGGPVTSYTVTSNTGGFTCTYTVTTPETDTCTVSGLTNKTAYTFTVKATNAYGTSPASTASASVTPGVASAPRNVVAVAGNTQATISWTPPASNGGFAITSYTATRASGGSGTHTCTYTVTTPETDTCTVTGLTNGTAYTFTVTATNAEGTSAASAASNSATPATVPGAPTIGTATAGNAQASVAFTAPSSNGGSAVTGYTVTATDSTNAGNGGETATGTASPIIVTGLTNGDSYTFKVTATNVMGTGAASAASASVTPAGPADAPQNVTATAGDQSAAVSWTPGGSEGSTILSYTVTAADSTTPANGGQTCTYTVSVPETDTCTVTGLTTGDSYTFTVTATNAKGTGPASSPSNAITPAGLPGTASDVSATAGDGQATVTFTDASDNGSAITGYSVTAADSTNPANGGQTATGSDTPITVTGLTDGDSYTFTVTATNGNGTGAASDPSNAVTPAGLPGTASDVSATAGDGQATVTFTDASDNGSAITGYTVTAADSTNPANGGQTATGSDTPITVTGLTDGDSYTFTVTATNGNGTGAASSPSNAVTPNGVPSAPTGVVATGGAASASVTFTAPGDNGSAITGYTVTAADSTNPANGGQTASGSGSPITVTGLTNGDSYTFTVTATNGNGTGAASAASNSVTPAQVADPPIDASASAGDSQATVSWLPGNDEGSTITSFTVTATDSTTPANGGQTCTYTVTVPETDTCTVTGLTNGDSYTFTVTATNGNGTGIASAASNSVTPSGLPGAPTGVSATAGDTQATVSFTAPGDNGSAITGYTVTAADSTTPANGGQTATGSGSPITVTGLTDGDSYTFTVTATNGNGTGSPSSASNAVTPSGLPGAPTGVSATAGNAQATVSFTAPGDNGSGITGYTVTAADATNPANGGQTATGSGSPITVTGLTNGDSYTFTVTATNGNGTGSPSSASNAVSPSGGVTSNVVFTSPSTITVVAGKKVTDKVTATGTPAPTLTVDGGSTLPSWLDVHAQKKAGKPMVINGTTPADAGGTYTYVLDGTNSTGTTKQTVTINVLEITSPASASLTAGTPATVDISTAPMAEPPTLTATGVPAGLTFTDNGDGTGTLTGTPATPRREPKTYNVHITETSGGTSAKQVLALTVS